MIWSIKLGRILGIDIKVHLTFLLILGWGAYLYGGEAGPLYGLLVTIALFVLVLLHELGHSVAAQWFGIRVKDIILLPIGGVARFEKMPEKPWQELIVAIAGPAVNVLLFILLLPVAAAIALLQHAMLPGTLSVDSITQPGALGLTMFLLSANVMLVLFNMLPVFPLDGGRVFRATLGFFMNYERATVIAVLIGQMVAVTVGIFGLVTFDFFLVLMAMFVYAVGGQEGQSVALRSVLRKITVARVLVLNRVALTPNATVEEVASQMMQSGQPNFAILDPDSHQLLGVTTSDDVSAAMAKGQWYWRVADIMRHNHQIPKINFQATLDEAQEELGQASSRIGAVYDDWQFRGLIDLADITRAFRLLASPKAREVVG